MKTLDVELPVVSYVMSWMALCALIRITLTGQKANMFHFYVVVLYGNFQFELIFVYVIISQFV